MTNPVTSPARRWVAALVGLALAGLHLPLLLWLAALWTEEHPGDVALSLATPWIIAGLLYLRREEVRALWRAPSPAPTSGAALALGAGLVALTALLLEAPPLLALSAPVALYAAMVHRGGPRLASPLLPPLIMGVFLVPGTHPELARFSESLQVASAEAATRLLQLLRFPSTRHGTLIATEDALNNVSEACSGMNTLTALLLFTLVLAFLLRLSARQTAASVVFLLPLALGINGGRVAFISWLHWRHGYDIAMGPLHDLSAYVLFGIAYAALFAFMRQLIFASNPSQPTAARTSQPPPSAL